MNGRRILGKAARALRRWLGGAHPIILMYHRVAALDHDPWELAVTPENFAGQLELLKRHRQIVPLDWLAARLREGKPTRRMAAISFDDGYVDVLERAKPLLERHNCPATIFLPPGYIGGTDGFWWDTLTRVFYAAPTLPDELELAIGGSPHRWPILPWTSDDGWSRRSAHNAVWGLLLPMPGPLREQLLLAVLDWAGLEPRAPADARCVTEDGARQLSIPGFLDIGAHTISHPSLPAISADEQLREIGGSISALHDLLGIRPRGVAYPYGHHDAATIAATRAAGAAYACTTAGRPVMRASALLALPRLHVRNVAPAEFGSEVLAHG
jgi:peptidoglycan/xylan/chitin deacetylase (PgdA/CDA1 family)